MINTSFAELNGINFEYFQNDVIGESSIAIGKEWESHITSFVNIYNSLYPIKNIIDVGSYFGYHTIFFSKNVQEKVYSFEPQSQNFQLLQNNINKKAFSISRIIYLVNHQFLPKLEDYFL
jgi:predicted O-methyltransferase YrrM